ncbi:caspase-2-like [Aphis craccivora]|uniref:Caspase-2-like n=1 Tax=Aphis craccivora TaxID=307492 RepID=A0A6G0YGN0_APHCR|nr:caspase-2-like [Aphis craccivora]
MEQYHRKLINDCMPKLICVTSTLETIVDNLLEKNVINEWMKDYILEPQGDSVKKLYELIQGRGPKAFADLCGALKKTNNITAYHILTSKTSEKYEQLSSIEVLNTTFNNTIIECDDPYVKIHPERKQMKNADPRIGIYPMNSNPKGHALILNISDIKNNDDTTGIDVNIANLNKLFKGLGYITHTKADVTEKNIINVIDLFVNICYNGKANSIVVFIMCHGYAGKDSNRLSDIFSTDGFTINTDWMIEQFTKNGWFTNIPKLFFIDACRGRNNEFGWKYCDGGNNYLKNDILIKPPIGTFTNHHVRDVFIAYATLPGCTSKFDPINGSWFVQKLCQVFREKACDTDLFQMMQLVDIELEKLNSIERGFQTVEWVFRNVNKFFYFNPGLYDDNSNHN